MCGGTENVELFVVVVAGLSPRVRGNRTPYELGVCIRRSIPACAGEPACHRANLAMDEVYPRVCGGTLVSSGCRVPSAGLSPRVRGNPPALYETGGPGGSIPACAGEPGTPRRKGAWGGVYPRVCGGTRRRVRTRLPVEGLSPRVRGNPLASRLGGAPRRSIPACAGEP